MVKYQRSFIGRNTITDQRNIKILTLHSVWKFQEMSHSTLRVSFWKFEVCGQIVLPDRSLLIGQKMVKNWNETFGRFSNNVVVGQVTFNPTKVNQKCQKWSILASFWNLEVCGQTVLPDTLIFWQKVVKITKIEKFKSDILGDFQILWLLVKQCYQIDHFLKAKNWWKIRKF